MSYCMHDLREVGDWLGTGDKVIIGIIMATLKVSRYCYPNWMKLPLGLLNNMVLANP